MVLGAWQDGYSSEDILYNSNSSLSGYWTTNMESANPSNKVSDNLNHRYYGYMRDLLSTEHSYPNNERVKELYEGGLKSWKESGYNPYYVHCGH